MTSILYVFGKHVEVGWSNLEGWFTNVFQNIQKTLCQKEDGVRIFLRSDGLISSKLPRLLIT